MTSSTSFSNSVSPRTESSATTTTTTRRRRRRPLYANRNCSRGPLPSRSSNLRFLALSCCFFFFFSSHRFVALAQTITTRSFSFEPFVLDLKTATPLQDGACKAQGMAARVRISARDALQEYASPGCGLQPVAVSLGARACAGRQSVLIDGGALTFNRGPATNGITTSQVSACVKAAMTSGTMLNKVQAMYSFVTEVTYWWLPVGGLPPTFAPTLPPTPQPTALPTVSPTASPSAPPTVAPTVGPTTSPTVRPTVSPTSSPSFSPTASPTVSPTASPSTSVPTRAPTTRAPLGVGETHAPTPAPSLSPTSSPSEAPTAGPTKSPTTSAGDDDDDDDDNANDDDDDNDGGGGPNGIINNPATTSSPSSGSGGNMGVVMGLLAGVVMILLGVVLWAAQQRRRKGAYWDTKNHQHHHHDQQSIAAAELDLEEHYNHPNGNSTKNNTNANNNTFDMMEDAMSESHDNNSGIIWNNSKQLGHQSSYQSSRDTPVHNLYPSAAASALTLTPSSSHPQKPSQTSQQQKQALPPATPMSEADTLSFASFISSPLDRMLAAGRSFFLQEQENNDGTNSGETPVASSAGASSTFEDEGKEARKHYNNHSPQSTTKQQPPQMQHNMVSPTLVKSRSMTSPISANSIATPHNLTRSTTMTPTSASSSSSSTRPPNHQQQRHPSVAKNRVVKSSNTASRSRSVRMSPVITTPSSSASVNLVSPTSPPRSSRGRNANSKADNFYPHEGISATASSQAMVTPPGLVSPAAVASMMPQQQQQESRDPPTLSSSSSSGSTSINVEPVQLRGQRRLGHNINKKSSGSPKTFLPASMMISNSNNTTNPYERTVDVDMESDDDDDRKSISTFGDNADDMLWDYLDNHDDNNSNNNGNAAGLFVNQQRRQRHY